MSNYVSPWLHVVLFSNNSTKIIMRVYQFMNTFRFKLEDLEVELMLYYRDANGQYVAMTSSLNDLPMNNDVMARSLPL